MSSQRQYRGYSDLNPHPSPTLAVREKPINQGWLSPFTTCAALLSLRVWQLNTETGTSFESDFVSHRLANKGQSSTTQRRSLS